MIFEVENVLLRALWAKRNAGKGTPAKYHPRGVAVTRLPFPVLCFPSPSLLRAVAFLPSPAFASLGKGRGEVFDRGFAA
jgi:hypothetical protein